MPQETIDLIGDPAIIAKIVTLAKSQGLSTSTPMPTESVSDAFDAPFGIDEAKQICEVITLVLSTGMSAVTFLTAVKSLLATSETKSGAEPVIEARRTMDQKKIGKITKDTDLSQLSG